MDIGPVLFWIHIGAAFAFVLAHGVSVFVSMRVRTESDPARLGALMDLSLGSVRISSLALLIIVLSGVLAAFVGNYWGRGWIWLTIGILLVLWVWMGVRGVGYFDAVRHALGKEGFHVKEPKAGRSVPDLAELRQSARPIELAGAGVIGLAVIVWLMYAKPF